jgi:hypothetical protein
MAGRAGLASACAAGFASASAAGLASAFAGAAASAFAAGFASAAGFSAPSAFGLLRLRGRLCCTRAVRERLGGIGLVHAGRSGRHLEPGLLENGQGILRGDSSFLRYLVDALLCHAVMNSKVSCVTVTGARKLRASGRPLSRLAAHCGLPQT